MRGEGGGGGGGHDRQYADEHAPSLGIPLNQKFSH